MEKGNRQRNWVFVTNSDFQIPISLQPNVVDIRYFKLYPVRLNIQSLKYQTFTLSGCKEIGLQKLMLVTKTTDYTEVGDISI